MKRETSVLLTAGEYIGEEQRFSCIHKTMSDRFAPHWHEFLEIELVVGGSGTQTLNGQDYPLCAGCVYLLSPLDFHSVTGSEDLELYNLMFEESLLPSALVSAVYAGGGSVLYLSEQEFTELVDLCRLMDAEYARRETYREEILAHLLAVFVSRILRRLPQTGKPEAATGDIQNAVAYIQRHFKDTPTLADTAATVDLHPGYFSRKFRTETGRTYTAYLTDLKVSYAKRLLRAGVFSVTEVCFASGFSSLSNFMKVFKSQTGMSPLQYANKKKQRVV